MSQVNRPFSSRLTLPDFLIGELLDLSLTSRGKKVRAVRSNNCRIELSLALDRPMISDATNKATATQSSVLSGVGIQKKTNA
jgi:hypothetical protein